MHLDSALSKSNEKKSSRLGWELDEIRGGGGETYVQVLNIEKSSDEHST